MNNVGSSNYSTDPRQLVPLWEEMGFSTGGMIGRFIGLNFLMGAQLISRMFNPLGTGVYKSSQKIRNNNLNYNNSNKRDDHKDNIKDINNYYLTIQTKIENEGEIKNIILKHNGIIN